jgi:hypothetical protein
MIRTVTVLVLLMLGPAVAPVHADTITFNDLTDSLSFTAVGTRLLPTASQCTSLPEEQCFVTLLAPAGTRSALIFGGGSPSTDPGSLIGEQIGEASGSFPEMTLVSDVLAAEPFPGMQAAETMIFSSDIDNGNFSLGHGICNVLSGECFRETGQVQLGATIVWCSSLAQDCIPPTQNSPGLNVLAVDTILFCSDVEDVSSTCSAAGNSVPAPATLLLLGAGLAGLASRLAWRNRSRT